MPTTTQSRFGMTMVIHHGVRAAATMAVLFLGQQSVGAAVIVDQSSGATGQFIQSQDFPNLPDSSAVAFDDFFLAAAHRITAFTALGREIASTPMPSTPTRTATRTRTSTRTRTPTPAGGGGQQGGGNQQGGGQGNLNNWRRP